MTYVVDTIANITMAFMATKPSDLRIALIQHVRERLRSLITSVKMSVVESPSCQQQSPTRPPQRSLKGGGQLCLWDRPSDIKGHLSPPSFRSILPQQPSQQPFLNPTFRLPTSTIFQASRLTVQKQPPPRCSSLPFSLSLSPPSASKLLPARL